jgi:putative tryptophan/tyrosine transport system substrate-binding protein
MRIGRTRLILALALGLFAWSVSADAQQPTGVPRVGILSDYSPLLAAKSVEPFVQGLRDLGYVEGQNIAFEYRHGDLNNEILPSLAAELVRLQPQVILAVGTPAAQAAKGATQTIPIVFARIGDPIGMGLVPALARPIGNLTGVSLLTTTSLAAKRLELLITAVPDAKRVGVLWDPSYPAAIPEFREIEGAARSLNVELLPAEVRAADDFEQAFRTMVEQRASALIVVGVTIFFQNSQLLVDLTVKAQVPAMFYRREFVEAGGLMSYAPNYPDNIRRAAVYVDKILKGAKPADIPVEQPTKFELVINLKTAKALGLTIPPLILGRADEVIE